MILAATSSLGALSAPVEAGDTAVTRQRTIMRTDTVTLRDTIVRVQKVLRKDVITRTEVVMEDKSELIGGSGATGNLPPRKVNNVIVPPLNGDIVIDYGVSSGNVKGSGEITVCPEPVDSLRPREVCVEDVYPGNKQTVSLPQKEGGRYLWVPDSLLGKVDDVIYGRNESSGALPGVAAYVDKSEKVKFRGDTVPMVLRDRNFGRFDRGLFNYLFIPKGIWQIGVTASYGEFSTSDLEIFDLISDIDFSGHIFSIRPYFSYFIGNNMSLGMRLGYTSGRANIDSFNVEIDDDMSFNLQDIYYKSESYTAALTFSQYFGMARRGRFGVYNEVELAFSSGNSDFQRPFNGAPKLTHTTTMQAALNFSPGVCVFIMDQVSFNVSFGVFGFSLRNEKQTVDGVAMGSRFTSGANFRFNIFNINFGIAVNL